jgi:phytoene synthase
VELSHRKGFPRQWTDAFLHSMEMDITKSTYANMAEVDTYIFGSAEVIGLYMSQILGLPEHSHPYAQYLGKAMQYINFIRDIHEDLDLGRSYFPRHDYEQYGLTGLTPEEAHTNPEGFRAFVRKQIERYDEWQEKAEEGFKYIPKRALIPILNASEMYKWTADRIREDPFIVYRQKVKPSVPRILVTMGLNTFKSVTMEDLSGEVGGLTGEVSEWRPIGSCEIGCHLS